MNVSRLLEGWRFYIVLEGGLEGFFVFVFQCLDFPSKVIKHCFNIALGCFDMVMFLGSVPASIHGFVRVSVVSQFLVQDMTTIN